MKKILSRFKFAWLLFLSLFTLLVSSGCNKKLNNNAKLNETSISTVATEVATKVASDSGQGTDSNSANESLNKSKSTISIDKNGIYDSKDEVALYIHTYNTLPSNYISKAEAKKLGWSGGSISEYAPGKCIGGSYFGNNEGKLPSKDGRSYKECDIDTLNSKNRGAKRIVYSNDGLIYYTSDHYESFELLYGEE